MNLIVHAGIASLFIIVFAVWLQREAANRQFAIVVIVPQLLQPCDDFQDGIVRVRPRLYLCHEAAR